MWKMVTVGRNLVYNNSCQSFKFLDYRIANYRSMSHSSAMPCDLLKICHSALNFNNDIT